MSLEEHIEELRKQRPEKCQTCECHNATFDFKFGGWKWVCDTAPDCYQEEPIDGKNNINGAGKE
jgi:hypothetical protein